MAHPNKLPYFVAAVLAFAVAPGTYAASPTGHFVVTGTGATATIYDTKTKLTWQQPTSISYTWAAATTYCGAATTLGSSGWRLPTIKELQTILDYSYTSSTTYRFASEFQSSHLFQYWSATVYEASLQTSQTSPSYVWYLDVYVGGTSYQPPSASYGAICVHSAN